MNKSEPCKFVELVARMRNAQREYFKTRDREVLSQSKKLEKQVDQYIDSQQRPGLF